MNRDASFEDAKRLYLESCGDPMVTNTYLKIALALLALVCVALALIDLRTIRTFENFRPLVIRIDDLGRVRFARVRIGNARLSAKVPPGFSAPGNAAGLVFDPSHVHVYADSLLVEGT